MQPINLYIFDENSRASVYGIGTYLKELTLSLKNSIVHITVVHLCNAQSFKIEEIDGISHWYIPDAMEETLHLDFESRTKQYYCNVKYLIQIHMQKSHKLIFHFNFTKNMALAETLRETFDCKLVFTIHYLDWCFGLFGNLTYFRDILTCQEKDLDVGLKKSIIEPYHKEKELFEKVDNIICLSVKTRQVLLDDYKINPAKTTVIYNGLTNKCPIAKKRELRKKYNIPSIPIFLFAGRLDNIKGVKYLLQAFKIVLDKQEECHLIIAGSGSFDLYMKECEDIWMNVTWTGLIDKAKLYDLYSIADVGLMPSLHEQCSYVAIEMMMHGVPLIASTSTGLCEMVEDGVTGLHIPVIEHSDRVEIDIPLLAEKMLYLLKHPEERKRMGANARKRYEQLYTTEVMRKNMLNFYTTLYDT
ncbi:MAG: TIGR04157 family glycosyltransferase [Fermentimonas sp.]|jgi:glycosyltransferase|nr:TIGR04157 family glycosyltransferase [Fermentimonas sp.]